MSSETMTDLAAAIKTAVNQDRTVFTTQGGEVHDRNQTVGGSESWQCIRKTWFSKHGQAHDPDYVENRGFFLRGHVVEDVVVDLLSREYVLHYTGENQVTLVNGRTSATPDCLLLLDTDEGEEEIVVEIKSLDPRSNFDVPKESHVFQAQLQIELFHRQTPHRPERAILIYMDASDFSHVVQHEVERDPGVFDACTQRAELVFSTKDPTSLPAEGKYSDECRYCPYTQACGEAVKNSFPTDTTTDLPLEVAVELQMLIDQRQEADAELALLKADKGRAEEQIKTLLRQHNLRSVKQPDWSISYTLMAGRKTLDTVAVEGAGIDLTPYYKQGRDSERLTVRSK